MKNKYKILIISCWVLLLACVIFKLCGADWFIAMTDNQGFIDFCKYVQSSFWFYIIGFLTNSITSTIYFMAILKDKHPRIKWFAPLMVYFAIKTPLYQYREVFFILDMIMMVIFPVIVNAKLYKGIILGFILNLAFQLISMYLKNPRFSMFDTNLVVGLIMSVDYSIMLILYYLYRTRKEE